MMKIGIIANEIDRQIAEHFPDLHLSCVMVEYAVPTVLTVFHHIGCDFSIDASKGAPSLSELREKILEMLKREQELVAKSIEELSG